MAKLDAAARELVSTKDLQDTVTYLCGLGEKVSGSEEERKACDFLTSAPQSLRLHAGRARRSRATSPTRAAPSLPFMRRQDASRFRPSALPSANRPRRTASRRMSCSSVQAATPTTSARTCAARWCWSARLPSPSNAVAAAKHGARGMICMSAGKQRHKMIITPVWGTPEFDQANSIPRVHVVSIAKTDGDPMVELLKDGPVRATLVADIFEGWRTVRLPTAELKGTEPRIRARRRALLLVVRRLDRQRHRRRLRARARARAQSSSTASCATASASPGGQATATAATRVRPGMPTRSGTSCATTRSSISTSTVRA